jgi:hypothetical protein
MIGDTVVLDFLKAICNDVAFPTATYGDLYLSMHTADPGGTGASEFSGGSYARSALLTWGTPASRAVATNAAKSGTASAQTATHWGLWTASTAGTFVWGGPLTTPRTFTDGQAFDMASGDIDLKL